MTAPPSPLAGQVALVTGGGGGLGSEIAARLSRLGAQVVVADIAAPALDATVARVNAGSGKPAEQAVVDVTDPAATRALVTDVVGRHGRLDVLVTSHGFPRDSRLLDMTDDEWADVIGVCLTGTFVAVREAARPMVENGYGRIVTITSRAWHGNPGQANYSAAKAGVVGLTRSVAKELGRHGVTANAVAPGLVETASLRSLATFDKIAERARRDNSIKRLGEPADVADAVAWLASPGAGFVTGEVVHVSGGRFS